MSTDSYDDINSNECHKVGRRSFLGLTTVSMAGIGAVCASWPLINSLNPSADVLAQSTVEVNISDIQSGQTKVVKWQDKPVFIRKRTEEEINEIKKINVKDLRDPQTDEQRTHKGKELWLVVLGVCTHLGCIPVEKEQGWFCPCHGSHYDNSGRILSGPAPYNLVVPDYYFASEDIIVIGKKGDDYTVGKNKT